MALNRCSPSFAPSTYLTSHDPDSRRYPEMRGGALVCADLALRYRGDAEVLASARTWFSVIGGERTTLRAVLLLTCSDMRLKYLRRPLDIATRRA